MSDDNFRLVESLVEAKAGEGAAIIVPTLRLNDAIDPFVREISALAQSGEAISVWRPIHSTVQLRALRAKFEAAVPRYRELLALCHERLSEPVERGSSMNNAWLQGYATALGTSALFRLQSAHQSLGEVIDRKAAYALAAISLYIAIVSLVLSVVFGWLSLK